MDGTTGLASAVDALPAAGLTRLGDLEVSALLAEVEMQKRRLAAVDHRLLAQVDERRVVGAYGRSVEAIPAELAVEASTVVE